MRYASLVLVMGSSWTLTAAALGAEEFDAGRVRAAAERALPPLQRGLVAFQVNYRVRSEPPTDVAIPMEFEAIGCISCHHEGLGLTTLSSLRRGGFAVDEGLARTEADLLRNAYRELAPLYRRALDDAEAARVANFFGDIAVQMGYTLGGLLEAGHLPDEPTADAARILLEHQSGDGSWSYEHAREPMQSSDFATTAMAARVLKAYAPADRAERADEAIRRARAWLLGNAPETTDDLAFRLLGLKWLGAGPGELHAATGPLRAIQRGDGGWAQLRSSAASDAYATGLALLAMSEGGGIPTTDPAYRRGVAFLLETQGDDGTWYVRKWSHAYNRHFEAGFPHGKSQFISLAGTCYAMMALARAVEPKE